MNHEQFCAEYAHENKNGRIVFTIIIVKRFIKKYTYLKFKDFDKQMILRLRLQMIDYYDNGLKFYNRKEAEEEKIVLPNFIFE